jgi:hypothetical protein
MVLAKMTGYMDCLVKNATYIWQYPENFSMHIGIHSAICGSQPPICLKEVGE